jgi:hypothetical protein
LAALEGFEWKGAQVFTGTLGASQLVGIYPYNTKLGGGAEPVAEISCLPQPAFLTVCSF